MIDPIIEKFCFIEKNQEKNLVVASLMPLIWRFRGTDIFCGKMDVSKAIRHM